MMHAKWMCHALTQEIITIKLSSSTNITTVYKVITKKHTEMLKSWVHGDKIKTVKSKVRSINYPHFA